MLDQLVEPQLPTQHAEHKLVRQRPICQFQLLFVSGEENR